MTYAADEAAALRLRQYFFDRIGRHLARSEQRASFATYAFGLLSEGERKSVEPIAARVSGDNPRECQRAHDRLLHFIGDSPWSDRAVRREAATYAIEALSAREPVTVWLIDDTGFPKQGRHSVGVQRQYSGTLGKIGNCQIGVSLSLATRTEQVPIDFELYLPESWTEDPVRRDKVHIPKEVVFKTKTDLALEMISRAVDDGIAGEIVLADSFYGRSHTFRDTVRIFGLDYAVAVDADANVWLLDARGRRHRDYQRLDKIAASLDSKAFRRLTYREGTKNKLSGRFCFRRVKVAFEDGTEPAEREPLWLVMEWPEGEPKPNKFFLTTLPRRMTKKQIVRIIKERWRTERVYQEMKGELGLDHFEGRSYPGWHHHISVVLCCYAFVVAERVRHFSPSRRGTHRVRPVERAA